MAPQRKFHILAQVGDRLYCGGMSIGEEVFTGALDAQIPGIGPVIWSVMDHRGIRPARSEVFTWSSHWTLIYFFTPTGIELTWERPKARAEKLSFAAGSALALAPGEHYSVDTTGTPDGGHHAWLVVDGLEATPVAPMLGDGRMHVKFRDESGRLGAELRRLAFAAHANERDPFWTMQALSRGVLDAMFSATPCKDGYFSIPAGDKPRSVEPLVVRVVEYLQRNVGGRVRLSDIAAHLHASPSTVSHYYRRATGEAPMQTLKRMRILQAKILLIRGQRVADIAERLGFCDEHHLAIAFRKAEGVSPRGFLKRHRPAR